MLAVFDLSAVFPDVAPMQGHAQLRPYWNEMRETWAGIRQDPLEVFDLGDGRYVVDVRWSGTGQRSGVEVDQRFAMLYVLRPKDMRVVRAELFPDVAAAMSGPESSASLSQ